MRIAVAVLAALASLLVPTAATFYACTNPNGAYYYINTHYYFNDQTAKGPHCPYFKDENGDGICDYLEEVTLFRCDLHGYTFTPDTAPGQHCPDFVDNNGDGLCDHLVAAQLQPIASTTTSTSTTTTSTTTSTTTTSTTTGTTGTISTTSQTTGETPIDPSTVLAGIVLLASLPALRRG